MPGVGANCEGVIDDYSDLNVPHYNGMTEVKIVSDGDHNYVIPASKREEFYKMLDTMATDYFAEAEVLPVFNAMFSKYRKNPDDLKLYTDEI